MLATRDPPPHRLRIDLKWHLARRVLLVAWLCLAAAGAFTVYGTLNTADDASSDAARAIAQTLELQLFRIDSGLEPRSSFPDWSTVFDHVTAPGQCVMFHDEKTALVRSDCNGAISPQSPIEAVFADAFSAIAPSRPHALAIAFKGRPYGNLTLTTDPASLAHAAWADVVKLSAFAVVFAGASTVLIVWVIGRALAPARDVLGGLERLAAGDLSCRLPGFDLAELDEIARVFNSMAAHLEATRAENACLARALIDGREKERQRLARDLHDEFAQNLAGLSAIAASIKTTADREFTGLSEEAALLSTTLQAMARSVRATLAELRPPEIDDLGLEASLKGLVAAFASRAPLKADVTLDIDGTLRDLQPTSQAHIYRIVQEALTNIEKHAQAKTASVRLARRTDRLEIAIEDDGVGADPAPVPQRFGLVGMRERVLALGGEISTRTHDGRGFAIFATVPLSEV